MSNMPSHMPSSFAAAAGQGSSRDSRNGRGDGRGSGDWVRKDNRTANGTVTLRRSSTNPLGQASAPGDAPLPTPTAEHPSAIYEHPQDSRYSKSFLLDLYKQQQESGAINGDISHLYENGWAPGQLNGSSGRGGWGKTGDGRESHAPDVCWDVNGETQPIGLEEMSEAEKAVRICSSPHPKFANAKQLFLSDVNSPLKPPPQNASKDGNTQGFGVNGRKSSISQGSSAFGLSSPASSRPSTRRQQTSDSISGLASPGGTGRFSRDENSPFFSRKFDSKDGDERSEEPKSALPFGGLMRANTAGSALGNGPASPWHPTSAISPMGTFGNFAFSNSTNPPTPVDKRPAFGRGESRFAQLMSKESSEELSKPAERAWRPRQRTDTDPFADEAPGGSAGDEGGRQHQRMQGSDTPVRGTSGDVGMSDAPGFREAFQRQSHQTPQAGHGQPEPLSPSDTNPYGSPPDDRQDRDDDSYDGEPVPQNRGQGLGGIPEHVQNTYGTLPRGFPGGFDGSDRSQTSSVSGNKGLPQLANLSSLGGMGGWPTSGHPIGTPDRENRSAFPSAFGSSLFGPMGELQSPGLGSLGSLGGMFGAGSIGNASGSNTIGRGSKLGSLFPAAMQAQMQATENEHPGDGEQRQSSGFGAIGRNAFPTRDTDSPMRSGRNNFEELFPTSDAARSAQPATTSDMAQGQAAAPFGQSQSNYQQSQASSDSASNQLPTAQQRMMVMPDRMRWVYLDPQGQVQGPFSGLEMHDWYKASFFTPDLSVKKLEDAEFEPLGQLIRRIGNSREPFLVPQIGIPHGQPSAQAGAAFTPPVAGPGTAQAGAVQPPFANSFPSFGTTLTAEQQNNLERRKQEEQYLMARQREFLAQQQVNMKQMQMGGLPASLHHHSSAHSLQSQPSFGSISSPIGMQPQPPIPNSSGFFDQQPRQMPSQQGMSSEYLRSAEEEVARLSLRERMQIFNTTAPSSQQVTQQQMSQLYDQSNAQNQGQDVNDVDFAARMQEFQQFQAQREREDVFQAAQLAQQGSAEPIGPPQQVQQQQMYEPPPKTQQEEKPQPKAQETLSLTEQVQKTVSAKQSPSATAQPESPWAKVTAGLPMPFPPPPPQSITPLPAPTAQRGRINLPEALTIESRSRSGTPEVASTPSVAPWAKEPAEAPKALSLKEIQDAEAKQAAKAEEVAAAARRANYEQELKHLTAQPVAAAPGLPTSSTWGKTGSPATPTTLPSPWAKPVATKSSATSKKTLADIQRDEENRKAKLAAASAATQISQGVTGGKRYADLASKPNAPVAAVGGPAWSTVGAGGKVKVPTGPSAPQTLRSVSSANVVAASISRVARPAPAARSVTTSGPSVTAAGDEFTKWAKATLEKGVSPGVNVNELVSLLSAFKDSGDIAETIYSSSQILNGNDFAAEYLRRREKADKGIVESANSGAIPSGGDKSGGWSEVAKKGPPKEEPTAGFKVIPNKKKGKK